jgi:hypothetical protein
VRAAAFRVEEAEGRIEAKVFSIVEGTTHYWISF